MSDDSDIELKSSLSKKSKQKTPKSPTIETLRNDDPKKISTKIMIREALTDLRNPRSRKGVSLQAVKKYIQEKFHFDVEKNKYIIKKYLKSAVEAGTIQQTKGKGASGSFRLVPVKEKTEKNKKVKINKEKKVSKEEMIKPIDEKKQKLIKPKITQKETKSKTEGKSKKLKEKKEMKEEKTKMPKTKPLKEKTVKITVDMEEKNDKKVMNKKNNSSKTAKVMKTPAKKRAALLKRKSIGSIIKPPKMKPKTK